MPGVINTLDAPYYSERSRLDGRDYVLDFAYNEREERWYLHLFDEAGNPILRGIKLVTNWPLLGPYKYDPRVPTGELVVTDLSGDKSPPTLLELGEGKRCELLYWTAAELEALGV